VVEEEEEEEEEEDVVEDPSNVVESSFAAHDSMASVSGPSLHAGWLITEV